MTINGGHHGIANPEGIVSWVKRKSTKEETPNNGVSMERDMKDQLLRKSAAVRELILNGNLIILLQKS